MVKTILLLTSAVGATVNPGAIMEENVDENQTSEVQTVEDTAFVKFDVFNGGDVFASVESGKAGDIVTLVVKPNFLYKLKGVYVNGTQLTETENGQYVFILADGDNTVTADFEIDNEQVKKIYDVMQSVKKNGVSSIITPGNVITMVSWVINMFFASGFFITLLKTKKIKSKTIEAFSEECKKVIAEINAEETKKFLESVMGPTLNKLLDKIDLSNASVQTLCRCFVLEQENTPEARLAIIEELTKLNNSDKDLSDKIKQIVNEEIKTQEENKQATIDSIQELKDVNENLTVRDEEETYGKI